MELSEDILTVYSGAVERQGGRYVVEVPDREVELGDVSEGDAYRVVLLSRPDPDGGADDRTPDADRRRSPYEGPPVDQGERRTVEIESIGDQGDGIARVERGYVVIVPDTEINERVTVEIADVRENVAFADVVERHSFYE